MRIRATLQLRNDHMVNAREEKELTQAEVAIMAGVSKGLISKLERLLYPATYRHIQAMRIAEVLELKPELVMPEKMAGWNGQTKLTYTREVPIERLLEYRDTQMKHYLLPSPDETTFQDEQRERINKILEKLPLKEREILKMRYGLKDGFAYTTEEVGRIFKVTTERVRQIEAKAIRKIQSYLSDPELAEINEDLRSLR